MTEVLTKERDQLLKTTQDLRDTLKETMMRQQETQTQRDIVLENISQVGKTMIMHFTF